MSSDSSEKNLNDPKPIDVFEHGSPKDGQPQSMNKRLFMQLMVFQIQGAGSVSDHVTKLGEKINAMAARAVIYQDFHDPRSIALLLWHTDENELFRNKQELFARNEFNELCLRPEMGMFGRTYSSGYEPDLAYWLINRAEETATNPEWPWAIWYPLRRKGSFERLEHKEQMSILGEHARIGRAYGSQDLAHDIRLVCHGLDTHDNDFVIALIGKELHPLSHVVQSMRKTRQTSEFIQEMGPFFVGRVLWTSKKQPPLA
ncbi:MAG: chlorite dismutase family protein [Myxococcales bacterium]|nr:MAG: chlorite dismutase family protein [Myxococcales bacterium]